MLLLGGPLPKPRATPSMTLDEKLRHHGWTVANTGCWEFDGRRNIDGYGAMKHFGRYEGAHRWAYRAWVGPIPKGQVVRHSCDNPPCVNPKHLLIGTQRDNIADTVSRKRQRTNRGMSWEQVTYIRNAYAQGETRGLLCRMFSVDAGTMSRILNGKLYTMEY